MKIDKSIGDKIVVNFGLQGLVNGEVSAIKFNDMQVLYDIKVYPFPNEPDNKHIFQELKDVQSYFVEKPEDRFIGVSNMPINELN